MLFTIVWLGLWLAVALGAYIFSKKAKPRAHRPSPFKEN